MFVAYDTNDRRIYADEAEKSREYFCPVCREAVRVRRGEHNLAHFAHKSGSQCPFGRDKDNKSEWHRRMQAYFPREAQEVRFTDDKTGEVHIADVFLNDTNTVLEFQKSPISDEEFLKRTIFHINHGHRIVWLFDESSSGSGDDPGRFRLTDVPDIDGYDVYKWLRCPRKALNKFPLIIEECNRFSVCVYTGTEGDVFRRIIKGYLKFSEVVFSDSLIDMKEDMDVGQFFGVDQAWIPCREVRHSGPRYMQPIRINVRTPRRGRL